MMQITDYTVIEENSTFTLCASVRNYLRMGYVPVGHSIPYVTVDGTVSFTQTMVLRSIESVESSEANSEGNGVTNVGITGETL